MNDQLSIFIKLWKQVLDKGLSSADQLQFQQML